MGRIWARVSGLVLATIVVAVPASAQVVQSLQVGVGAFFPRGFDTRVDGDTLVADLVDENPLAFRIGDFKSAQLFAEWNVAFGDHLEVGAGLGFSRRSVPTLYRDLQDADTGFDIEQTLKLRMVPITGVVRFLPFGDAADVQPYVGVGAGVVNFRYSEAGDFVDPSDLSIFSDRFTATGNAPIGIVLGGVRFPIGGDIYGLSIEGRYQFGSGDTGGLDAGFLGDKIDLSGGQLNFGFLVRF
jgi:hypothetical protein